MKKYAAFVLMLAMVAVIFSGCIDYSAITQEMEAQLDQPEATPIPPLSEPLIESREDFYRYYNQVSLNDTAEDLHGRFPEVVPEAVETENAYAYVFPDGYGFVVVFDAKGAMQAKVPYYIDIRQLKPLTSGRNLDQAGLITQGQDYQSIASMFASTGIEIMQMPPESEDAEGVQRVFLWIDENNLTVQASFDENNAFLSINSGSIG